MMVLLLCVQSALSDERSRLESAYGAELLKLQEHSKQIDAGQAT